MPLCGDVYVSCTPSASARTRANAGTDTYAELTAYAARDAARIRDLTTSPAFSRWSSAIFCSVLDLPTPYD
jgi:hypothetical protein